jgi:hypothetical protein
MIEEGDTGADTFYIVFSGEAVASKKGMGVYRMGVVMSKETY